MKHIDPHQALMEDILKESNPSELYAETLDQTLAYARQRRRQREWSKVASVCVCLLLFSIAVFMTRNNDSKTIPNQATVVQQQQPVVVAENTDKLVEGTGIEIISDEELFELFADRPIAVIQRGDQPQVVFLDEWQHQNQQP